MLIVIEIIISLYLSYVIYDLYKMINARLYGNQRNNSLADVTIIQTITLIVGLSILLFGLIINGK